MIPYAHRPCYPQQPPRPVRRQRRKPAGQDPSIYHRDRRGIHGFQGPRISTTNTSAAVNIEHSPASQTSCDSHPLPVRPAAGYMPPYTVGNHAHTVVWKSAEVIEREEWQSALKKVRHIAPGYVKAGLFPKSAQEWHLFKYEIGLDLNKAILESKGQTPTKKPRIKPVFGVENKVFNDNCGPVLAMPTIWSQEFVNAVGVRAGWPSQAELLKHGDQRPRGFLRSFPPPRSRVKAVNQSYHHQAIIKPYLFDEVEPEFSQGPPYHIYVNVNKQELDRDSFLDIQESCWLDAGLLEELGFTLVTKAEKEKVVIQEEASKKNHEHQLKAEAVQIPDQRQTNVETVQLSDQNSTPSEGEESLPQPKQSSGMIFS